MKKYLQQYFIYSAKNKSIIKRYVLYNKRFPFGETFPHSNYKNIAYRGYSKKII